MDCCGSDTLGQLYKNVQNMWEHELRGGAAEWYSKAVRYWEKSEPSVNGVLGGFGEVSPVDIRDSEIFLKEACRELLAEKAAGTRKLTVLDCGAGVGRISQELLLRYFDTVDLCEPVEKLIRTAEFNLGAAVKEGKYPEGHKPDRFMVCGLQQVDIEDQRYDVIWVQWALLYLTDDDAVELFNRAAKRLKPGGVVVVKENTCKEGFVVDHDDSSITRSHKYMQELFSKSDLKLFRKAKQTDFPKELYDVRMYALRGPGNAE